MSSKIVRKVNPGAFTLDGETIYQGYGYVRPLDFNPLPLFTREVGEQIALEMAQDEFVGDMRLSFNASANRFEFFCNGIPSYYPAVNTPAGVLYAIGKHEWTWKRA